MKKILLTIVLLIAIIIGGTYYVREKSQQEASVKIAAPGEEWVNFESKKLGFTVRYPRQLTVYECTPCDLFAPGVFFSSEKIENLEAAQWLSDYIITVDNDSPYKTLDEAVRAYQEAPAGIQYVVKDTTVDRLPAKVLYYDQEAAPLAYVILIRDKRMFVFGFGNSLKQKSQGTLEGIIASFRLGLQ